MSVAAGDFINTPIILFCDFSTGLSGASVARERDTVLAVLQGSLNEGAPGIKYQEGCAYERTFLSFLGETLYIASNRSSAVALRNLSEFSVARQNLRLC